jgi:hypothetical protein
MFTRLPKWILVFVAASACVDPIAFDAPPAAELLVIDGSITDQQGPYTVKITRGLGLDADTNAPPPVTGVVVKLHDDLGSVENFTETAPGMYSTGGTIRGTIGRSYHITLQMPDGSALQSEPEKILPTGEVQSIRYEFEPRRADKGFGILPADVFNIYIDADGGPEVNNESYLRWRFTGTYKVETFPQLHMTLSQEFYYRDPRPCSGFVVAPAPNGGVLEQVAPCVCCTCWVKLFETQPQLSDTELVNDGQFRNLKVGEVPINPDSFFHKVLVEVEQMSISKVAFDYFRIIRTQKEGASDLFQPAQGRLRGNISSPNNKYQVVGLFWAASISKKSIYLSRTDVPYPLAPMEILTEPCYVVFQNATTTKPANWND